MKKSFLLSSLLLTIFLVGCNKQEPVKVEEPVAEPAAAQTEIYSNEELGFSLEIPAGTTSTPIIDEVNRLIVFENEEMNFEVRMKEGKFENGAYTYLDFPIASETTVAGKKAVVFEAPKGYCDGPGCSDPFIAIAAEKSENEVLNVVFHGDAELSEEEKAILDSLKFLE